MYVYSNELQKQSEDGQQSKTHRSLTLEDETSMKTEESRNAVSHTDIAVAAELSSQLDRQHIVSNEYKGYSVRFI